MGTTPNADSVPSEKGLPVAAETAVRVPFVRPALPPAEVLAPHLDAICRSGRLTKGPYLERFEAAAAAHLGVRHAIGVSSCTTGLMLVYRSLAELAAQGCTASDRPECPTAATLPRGGSAATPGEVVMPSFTFLAGPAAVVWNGLRPVFVDVDAASTNARPEAVAAAITPRTVAISACHNFGNPCDVTGLREVARKHGLPLVIDAAHGFGAKQHGIPVGGGATAQVFSLSPTKLLVAGEGGIVATDCDCLASLVRIGREYGNSGTYDASFSGCNGRMPEMCAATAWLGLDNLEAVATHRRGVAWGYAAGLGELAGIAFVEVCSGDTSSHKDFSIAVDPSVFGATRDDIRLALTARGIETRTYYDPPCHRQTAFRRFHDGLEDLPITDRLAARSLSLPIGPHVDEGVIGEVCETIAACQRGR